MILLNNTFKLFTNKFKNEDIKKRKTIFTTMKETLVRPSSSPESCT